MPPASIRTPTKRNVAALPETSRLTFLLAASQLVADTTPQVSSHLGRLALKWADAKQLPLPRGSIAQLCRHCGAHCTSMGAVLVKISRAQRRQKVQGIKHTQHRHSEQRVVAVCPCQVCNGSYVRSFVNEDAAHKAFPLAAFMPVVKAAARQPVDNCMLTAAPSLGGAALSEAHSTSEDPQSNKVPEEPQQAAGCADASTVEHYQLRAASEATLHQTNSSSANCRPCHLALPDFPADTALEPAHVAPSSGVASIQNTTLSKQHDLMVRKLNHHCEASCEVDGQHAQTPGSLSPGPQMKMQQATRIQTEEPKATMVETTAQSLQDVGNTHTGNVQVGEVARRQGTIIHDEQETLVAAGMSWLDDAGEAQAGESSDSARLSRAPELGAMRKRRPFSWRKHGRSWRCLSPKQLAAKDAQWVCGDLDSRLGALTKL